ncbi:MAG: hypothetical protein ACI4AD_10640 [Roseburia sp.]
MMFVNPYSGEITLSELILQLSGSRGEFPLSFSMTELISFAMRLIPYFVFESYMGISLYRHFCTASIYVFSRYPNRVKWYWKEIFFMIISTAIFEFLLLVSTLMVSMMRCQITVDWAGILLMLYHFFIYTFWICKMVAIINLLALWLGSSTSFALTMGVQMVEITLLGINNFIQQEGLLLKYNPISHLVLGWHDSSIADIRPAFSQSYAGLYLNSSVFFQLFTCVVILGIGSMIVKKHNLLVSDLEMGV